MSRALILLGAVAGLSAVAMAAAAAHALPARLDPARLQMVQSAIQMQGWHAPALVATGLWAERGGRLARYAGGACARGRRVCGGAVYGRGCAGGGLARAAPLGGVLLMLGWALLGASALRR